MNWLLVIIGCLIVCYTLLAISLYRNAKRMNDENKHTMDGVVLGGEYLSKEDMGYVCGEQPFIERYKDLN